MSSNQVEARMENFNDLDLYWICYEGITHVEAAKRCAQIYLSLQEGGHSKSSSGIVLTRFKDQPETVFRHHAKKYEAVAVTPLRRDQDCA